MNIKKIITAGIIMAVASALALDYVEVIDVKARQRYPWNGLVDIDFELDSKATEPYMMKVVVFDNVGKTNLPVKTVYTEKVSQKANPCMVTKDTTRIVWDAAADLPDGFKCTNVLVTCQDTRCVPTDKLYCVIDLSAGSEATSCPVTYLDSVPAGGWTDEYKTTKLVLRRIEKGTFMMGSPESETGRNANEDYHKVTLTKDFYISVFEMTEAQYAYINGGDVFSKKPQLIQYRYIRGDDRKDYYSKSDYCWPDSNVVDPNSVVGRLRDRTSINTFDLPTEAQWEYASRAGCELSVNIGMDCTAESVNMVGRNTNNRNDGKGDASLTLVTHVGLYIPNAVGIYDMLGNAAEWCVDAYSEKLGLNDNIDPVGGVADGTWSSYKELLYINRVTKGGGVIATEYGGGYIPGIVDSIHSGNQLGFFDYNYSRSASRVAANEATRYLRCGFRVLFIVE